MKPTCKKPIVMSNSNQISLSIPQEKVDEAKQFYSRGNAILALYQVSLTNDQKAGLPKMGDKSLPFVTKGARIPQHSFNSCAAIHRTCRIEYRPYCSRNTPADSPRCCTYP